MALQWARMSASPGGTASGITTGCSQRATRWPASRGVGRTDEAIQGRCADGLAASLDVSLSRLALTESPALRIRRSDVAQCCSRLLPTGAAAPSPRIWRAEM